LREPQQFGELHLGHALIFAQGGDARAELNKNHFRDYDPQVWSFVKCDSRVGMYVESDPMDAGQHARYWLAAAFPRDAGPPLEFNGIRM
jgi:hypothetical protein